MNLNDILNNMIKAFDLKHFQSLINRGDEMTNMFVKTLKEKASVIGDEKGSLEKVMNYLKKPEINKTLLANHIFSAPGVKDLLGLKPIKESKDDDKKSKKFKTIN